MDNRRWAPPVVALLTALVAAGCTEDDTPSSSADATKTGRAPSTSSAAAPPPATAPPPAPSPTLPKTPQDVADYEDVCEQDQAGYRSPAAYTGPGPHPVLLFPSDSFYVRDMPAGWVTDDPQKAALIVCQTTRGMTTKLGDCTYKSSRQEGATRTVPLYGTTYTLTVRELHTNSVVTTVEHDMDAYDCPPLTTETAQSVNVNGILPTSWVIDDLRPLVDGTPAPPPRTP
ncbi:MAG: hypothetical protein HOV68_22035 [Streptomycetaceae bacterium]|nr:hypothetical protein [Streptomycetaceae bacterium]